MTSTHLNLPPSVIAALDAEMHLNWTHLFVRSFQRPLRSALDPSLHSLFQVSVATQSSMVGIDDGIWPSMSKGCSITATFGDPYSCRARRCAGDRSTASARTEL